MDFSLFLSNLPALFFFLGVLAFVVKSDLEIPSPIPKFLSLYLLLAIGLKGGFGLAASQVGAQDVLTIVAALGLGIIIPISVFFVAKKKLGVHDAAGLAASFGSVSAVTFITASNFLQNSSVPQGGIMVAILAILEAPAIVIAVVLSRKFAPETIKPQGFKKIFHEAFLGGSVLLLLGALLIALVSASFSPKLIKDMEPFYKGPLFNGLLCLFLLELGILAARKWSELKTGKTFLFIIGIVVPVLAAGVALGLSLALGLSRGNALLFIVIAASASYIAVPAVIRQSIPQSNPGVFLGTALGITFPFNVIIGIPLYYSILEALGVKV